MRAAIALAAEGMERGDGGPFGCIIVKEGAIVGRGNNRVTSTNDPTAHAEMVAIRDACSRLGTFQLHGCVLYASCEPCPMCLGAIYWARPERLVYAGTREDAADAGFDDRMIHEEITLPPDHRHLSMEQVLREDAQVLFQRWKQKGDKVRY